MATTSPLVFVSRSWTESASTTWWRHSGNHRRPEWRRGVDRPDERKFLWGRSKSDAVELWAHQHGADLADSWAYSDSYFDAPLLAKVGHPVAVNPDLQLRVMAAIRGWPVAHFDRSDGVSKILGRELQEWGRPFMRSEIVTPNARIEFEGLENIPATGPAILVFNHRSYFDPIVMGP